MCRSRSRCARLRHVPRYHPSRNSLNAKTTRKVLAVRKPISWRDNCLKRIGFGRAAKSARSRTRPSRILRCEALETRAMLSAVYYVDAVGGNDAWNGLAGTYRLGHHGALEDDRQSQWPPAHAGRQRPLQRGDMWREQLMTDSGSAGGRITYGAYGNPACAEPGTDGFHGRRHYCGLDEHRRQCLDYNVAPELRDDHGSQLLPNPSFQTTQTTGSFYLTPPGRAAPAGRTTAGYESSPGCDK